MKAPDVDWSSIPAFLADAMSGATPLQWLWQALAVALSLALGYLFTRLVCRRMPDRVHPGWRFGKREVGRVVFPLITLVLLGVAEFALNRFQSATLVNAAKALVLAIRRDPASPCSCWAT